MAVWSAAAVLNSNSFAVRVLVLLVVLAAELVCPTVPFRLIMSVNNLECCQ